MVAAGYVPFANLVVVVAFAILPAAAHCSRWTWCLAPAWLLIVPPIVVRLLLAMRPLAVTDIELGSSPFLVSSFIALIAKESSASGIRIPTRRNQRL